MSDRKDGNRSGRRSENNRWEDPKPRKRSERSGQSGRGSRGSGRTSSPRAASEPRVANDPFAEAYPYAKPRAPRDGAQRGGDGARKPGGRPGPKGKRPAKGAPRRSRRFLKLLAVSFALAVLAGLVTTGVVYGSISKSLPDPSKPLKGSDQTTRIVDRRGKLMAKLFAEQNRTNIPLSKVPLELRQAVIATEDERFYDHKGVDPLGITRALITDIRTGTKAQGGSTITQQYVKQAFMTPERTLKRKVSEAVLAYRVEKAHSKDKILEMYLNTIYYGHNAYGVESAAQRYFGKPASKLTLAESAMIAGVIKSPGRYSPYLDPEAARGRRATVLAQMLRQGHIDQEAHDRAVAEPIRVVGLKENTTFAPYFVEYVKTMLIDKYGSDAVFRGGMTVKTTLDMRMQRAAEKAVKSTLNRDGDPSAALVAVDPKTGEILAMVGGRDYKTQQYNVAVQGHRQPGSAFKPFVLVSALESDVSPEATFESGPVKLKTATGPDWKVTGAGGGRRGKMRLREATERSVNSVYAQLILDLGAENVVKTARRLGVATKVEPVPAIALGGLRRGVTPLEMASAYGTLANNGERYRPHALLDVRDVKGKVILSMRKVKPQQVISEKVAYLTTDILRGVISKGTGKAANIGRPAAGKTGTTQAYRDAWFVGYTPDIATSVWVGYPDSAREMDSVHGIKVTGGSFPAQIWASFMREAHEGKPVARFKRPGGLSSATVCSETGLKATEYCPKKASGLFLAGKLPKSCGVHTTPTEITIPNLVGMTKEAALAALKKLMLLFKVVEQDVEGVNAGIVARQTPKAGSKGTTETVVTIVVSSGNAAGKAPKASFSFSPDPVSFGQAVTFDASSSSDDGKIVSYVWEFGDGTKASGKTVTHTYAADGPSGPFEVILWVTDDDGRVSSVRKTVRAQ